MNKIITAGVAFIVMASIVNAKVKVTGSNHKEMLKEAKKAVIVRTLVWAIAIMLFSAPFYLIDKEYLVHIYIIFLVVTLSSVLLIGIRFNFIEKQVKKAIKEYKKEEQINKKIHQREMNRKMFISKKNESIDYLEKQKQKITKKALSFKVKSMILENSSTGEIKKAPVGLSWTTLFFSFFPAFIRGDVKWGFIQLIFAIPTFGLSSIIFMVIYNKLYINKLLNNGFEEKEETKENLHFSDSESEVGIAI